MRDSMIFILLYVLAIWALLALFASPIADIFGATGETRELILFFCVFVAGSFLFNGMLFVASAAFNNLGFPTYSTAFNWGRSTLGVIPFVFAEETSWQELGLKGDEVVTIEGLDNIKPRARMTAKIAYADGRTKEVPLLCRIDTLDELEYFRNGGILHYVLRDLAA
jgi:hypothetical protein